MFLILPIRLKILVGIIFFIALSFILHGFYAYSYKNGTSWNFGAMGMYTKIDYPGVRWLKIYTLDEKSNTHIEIDPNYTRHKNFKEFESYLSLPSITNAKNFVLSSFSYITEPVYLETWTIGYDSKNHSVKKYLIEKHIVKPDDFKTNK